ncbi:hypothetical protein P7K49_008455, partial [Saguinus oedipus]
GKVGFAASEAGEEKRDAKSGLEEIFKIQDPPYSTSSTVQLPEPAHVQLTGSLSS